MQNPEVQAPILYPLTFIERKEEYPHVYSYVFESKEPVMFTAGQYGHVRIPTLSIPRPVREFSFASAPHEEQIVFGIDHRSGSEYQQALLALLPGETVELFKIKSHLTWPPPVNDVVMIAGGVGVTPFRSMLRDKAHTSLSPRATLIHAARDHYLYGDELSQLVSDYRAIRRPEIGETIRSVAGEHTDAHFYIAGPPDFVTTVHELLTHAHISKIESDAFKGLTFEESTT